MNKFGSECQMSTGPSRGCCNANSLIGSINHRLFNAIGVAKERALHDAGSKHH